MPSKLTILNSFFWSAVKKLATSKALVVTIVLIAIVNFSSNFYFLIILLSKVSGCLRYSFFPFSPLSTSSKPNTLGPIMTSTTQYYHHQWHCQYSFWVLFINNARTVSLPSSLLFVTHGTQFVTVYTVFVIKQNTFSKYKLKKHHNDIKGERHWERSAVWARRGKERREHQRAVPGTKCEVEWEVVQQVVPRTKYVVLPQ